MNPTAIYMLSAVVSYLLGSIPFGYVLVRLFLRQDVRATGSGNIGATNVARAGGAKLGVLTLVLDAAKGYFAVWLIDQITAHHHAAQHDLATAIAALFAILGHVYTIWLRFKGGKGVATGVGTFLALAPKAVGVVLLVFVAVVAISRYVSLGSILAAAAFPMFVYLFYRDRSVTSVIVAALAALLIIVKHHTNIRRLFAGTESKLGAKSA